MKHFVPLFSLCLCAVLLLSGCEFPAKDDAHGEDEVVTVTPPPTPTPIPTPDAPIDPSLVVKKPSNTETPNEKEITLMINDEEETVTMSYVSGSFSGLGGPDFSLYVDQWRYQVNAMSGYCYLTLRTGMSGDVYSELGFQKDTTAQKLSSTILTEYGVTTPAPKGETVTLGANEALYIHGETIGNVYDVYLIDVDGGCVTLVVCTTPATQTHNTRLTACLETLEIS